MLFALRLLIFRWWPEGGLCPSSEITHVASFLQQIRGFSLVSWLVFLEISDSNLSCMFFPPWEVRRDIGFETKLLLINLCSFAHLERRGGGQAEVKTLEEGLKRPTPHISPYITLPETYHFPSALILPLHFQRSLLPGGRADRWGGSGAGGEKSQRLFWLLCIAFACLAVGLVSRLPFSCGGSCPFKSPGGLEHITTLSERPWPGRSPLPQLQTLDRGRLEEVDREGEEEEEADAEGGVWLTPAYPSCPRAAPKSL